jgi:hypothetical protein
MGRYRASNCRCFHQPDDGDRQRAICQCADQVQIEERQIGERRERLRQRPKGAHTGFLQRSIQATRDTMISAMSKVGRRR